MDALPPDEIIHFPTELNSKMVRWCYYSYTRLKSSLLENMLHTPPATIRSIGQKLNEIQWLLLIPTKKMLALKMSRK